MGRDRTDQQQGVGLVDQLHHIALRRYWRRDGQAGFEGRPLAPAAQGGSRGRGRRRDRGGRRFLRARAGRAARVEGAVETQAGAAGCSLPAQRRRLAHRGDDLAGLLRSAAHDRVGIATDGLALAPQDDIAARPLEVQRWQRRFLERLLDARHVRAMGLSGFHAPARLLDAHSRLLHERRVRAFLAHTGCQCGTGRPGRQQHDNESRMQPAHGSPSNASFVGR